MNRVYKIDDIYLFYCPGCKKPHLISHRWGFNGDLKNPTFTPSLLVNCELSKQDSEKWPRCHSFITEGKIRFLGDCDHNLKNKEVEVPFWYRKTRK